jgi:Zn-dependent M28 family amino/carboxypeptidase
VKPTDLKSLSLKENVTVKGKLNIVSSRPEKFIGKNVAGVIEGTDPSLKEQYVIMTAHYDHIGVQQEQNQQDSIFNGARDNATGTVALLQAAKFFSKNPPKRSLLLVAVTSEEKGVLGSSWYVKHPLVPLKSHVLNINCDGVGYNDKTRVTSISLGRTNLDDLIVAAAKDYDLAVGGDPDPREGFYERSDQVSFAKEGIPAIKLQPGLAQMDQAIFDYYHRPADEASSLDFDYITKFYRVYIDAVQRIVNDQRLPAWTKGDKFEETAKKLYGK